MTTVPAALALLLLTGCAIRPHNYRAPITGPTATVIFQNATRYGAAVSMYEDAVRCSRRSMIHPIEIDSAKKVAVRADKELALTFGAGGRSGNVLSYCRLTASFLPASNQTYHVALLMPAGTGACALVVNRVSPQSGGTLERVNATLRVPNENPFNENSDFCKPL